MSGRVVVIGPIVTIINDSKPIKVEQEKKKEEVLDTQETQDIWQNDSTSDFDKAWEDYCK